MCDSSPLTITEVLLPARVEPSGLQLRQRTLPTPQRGECLVKVDVTGISFAERAMRRGVYPGQPRFPFVPGYDLVGHVLAAGKGVPHTITGQPVAAIIKTGGWSSHALVPFRKLVPLPSGVEPTLAETVLVNGVTAWQMLVHEANIKVGQTILVHGANGGVGTVLCQLGRHFGARVLGTASPQHHDSLRKMGVVPLDYGVPDLTPAVRAFAPSGVNAIFDHLGLESARKSYSLLAERGSLILYGNASSLNTGTSPLRLFLRLLAQITLWKLRPKGHRVTFYNFRAGSRIRPGSFQDRLAADLQTLFGLVREGVLRPPIGGKFPLSQVTAAMQLAESRTLQGKVLLLP